MIFRLILILVFFPLAVLAQLSVAPVFSDNMVLQQNKPILLWGKGRPKEKINVSFAGISRSTICLADSSWAIQWPAQKANAIGQQITIRSGKSALDIKNILIGEVWLCIGQSNMEWPMHREKHYASEKQSIPNAMIRFLNPSYAGKNIYNAIFTDSVVQRLSPKKFYLGNWETCDSNSFQHMSAVAYYFGKAIVSTKSIPIGLINLSIGGAPLETFIDPKALAADPRFADKIKGNWLKNDALPVWIRERGIQNVGALPNCPSDTNGKNHGYKPGFAYQAGIHPLIPFPIAGILNYQGESNAQEIERVNEYADLTALIVSDLRKKWKDPKLPYYFVQLSSIDTLQYKGQLWPAFRNMQRTILSKLSHVGMAVTTDVGSPNDVHPTNKKIVGERLARWTLNRSASGPLPIKAKWYEGKIIISFQNLGNGLTTLDGQAVRGFSIDGKTEIKANISPNKKSIWINAQSKPTQVFFSWKPFSDANLCNAEMLPASTFIIPVQ